MATLLLRKRMGGTLEPIDDTGRDMLAKIAAGDIVRADVHRPRNVLHHRKWWALVSLIYANQSRYGSPEELDDAIKVSIGHCTAMRLKNGTEVRIPKSIAFHAMDQSEFEQFYDRAIKLVCEEIIPRLDEGDLRRELMDLAA